MKKICVFSPSYLCTHNSCEANLVNKLNEEGLNVELVQFSNAISLDLKKDVIDTKKRHLNNNLIIFFGKFYLNKFFSKYDIILTRPIGGYKAHLLQSVFKYIDAKVYIYSINSIGSSYGSGFKPELYFAPGIFWKKLINKNLNFLCGLKKYNYPFINKNNHNIKTEVLGTIGHLGFDEILSKKDFFKKYNVRKKFILFCLEASAKYTYENLKEKKYLNWTINLLNKISTDFKDYEILIKPHPFQIYKPFSSYKRKQLDVFKFFKDFMIIDHQDHLSSIRYCDFAIVNNSSILYEVAQNYKPSVVICDKEEDLYTKSLFPGGFFAPEVCGKIFIGYDNFKNYFNKNKNLQFHKIKYENYIKKYIRKLDIKNLLKFLK